MIIWKAKIFLKEQESFDEDKFYIKDLMRINTINIDRSDFDWLKKKMFIYRYIMHHIESAGLKEFRIVTFLHICTFSL